MNLRRFCSLLCCISCLVSAVPFSALAASGSSTPSNAEDWILDDEWMGDDGQLVDSSGDDVAVPFAFSPLNVTVTADVRRRSDGVFTGSKNATWSVSGQSYVFTFPNLPDGQFYSNVQFRIKKSMLPKPGKYGLEMTFSESHLGLPDTGNAYIRLISGGTNIYDSSNQVKASFSGGTTYTIKANVDIGYDTTQLMTFVDWPFDEMYGQQQVQLSEDCFKFTFKEQSGAPSVSSPDIDAGGSADDYIADNIGGISSGVADVNDSLKEIIQTISNQLEAFWDQQYNYIHLPDMANRNQNTDKVVNSQQAAADQVTESMDENTGIITGALDRLGNFLIDGLKGLFIPSDEFFKTWFDDIYSFFQDRLGFLMLPLDILVRFVELFQTAGSVEAGFPFPEFKWLDGTVIIPAQTVRFSFLDTEFGQDIQQTLYFLGNLMMIGALLSLMHRKFEEVLRS